ncbi:unnamed protein product, partial [marine sediment metagenome]
YKNKATSTGIDIAKNISALNLIVDPVLIFILCRDQVNRITNNKII